MKDLPLLSALTFLPLAGGLLVLALGERRAVAARRLALAVAGLGLALAAGLAAAFDPGAGTMQFVEKHRWIPALAVDYHLGLDGLSLVLVGLTTLLVPGAMLAPGGPRERRALYWALMLFLETGLLGTFTALNFFHWFLFWELSLIPAFFLIKLWGGPESGPAATQFFLYTLAGSAAMLLAFLAIFLAVGKFDFLELAELGRADRLTAHFHVSLGWYSLSAETLTRLVFAGVFLGLAVKVPVMPLHTWLPAAYAEAPTGVTMLLTGAMSKMGVYGFARLLVPIFPEQVRALQTPLLALVVFTILFSAATAFAQRDLKRMLAYSSINHLGYALLGLMAAAGVSAADTRAANEQAAALNGVFFQLFAHGVTAATLFAAVGWLEQRSGGRRGLEDFGGLRRVAPVFTGLTGIALFASLGLPGLCGFVGEFLIFKGAFALAPAAAAAALPGLLLTAVFLLTLMQRVFHGPLEPRWAGLADLTWRERLGVAPAVAVIFVLGIWPQGLLHFTNATVVALAEAWRPF
jgi:NADH-quinone oxidoreductase subunit M